MCKKGFPRLIEIEHTCPLCSGDSQLYAEFRNRTFWLCQNCKSVYVDPSNHLSPSSEKKRYLSHNNDVYDPKYQAFVFPIVEAVKKNFTPTASGLDFGAGTGPVTAKLLEDNGYLVALYDPYFCNDVTKLDQKYDYIIACEVIEHFRKPYQEFYQLRTLLKEGGKLFCMTSLFTESIDFQNWYYKNDETHLFFYHQDAIAWIGNYFHFKTNHVIGNLIEFST